MSCLCKLSNCPAFGRGGHEPLVSKAVGVGCRRARDELGGADGSRSACIYLGLDLL